MQVLKGHYQACFDSHGDSAKGMDWSSEEQADAIYQVMYELIRPGECTLLDFGCGSARFLDYLKMKGLADRIDYVGTDWNAAAMRLAKDKHRDATFVPDEEFDNLKTAYDYVVVNGVCTEKLTLSYQEMFDYALRLVRRLFAKTRIGLAINFTSKFVDWERDDLFHVPIDDWLVSVIPELTRNVVVRHDYGFYQFTTYLFK